MKALKYLIVSLAVLFTTACGDGKSKKNIKIPGVQGPVVTLVSKTVRLSMVVEKLHLDLGLRYSIPKYPNSSIEISPDLKSDGTVIAFNIAVQDLMNENLHDLDPLTLPGGRALPGVLEGSLPAVAFTIKNFQNTAIYMGRDIVGVFIPVKAIAKLGQFPDVAYRFYSGKNRVGNLALIGPDAKGENSGILVMLDFNQTVKDQMQSLL